MTINEMHQAINQGLQKISSMQVDIFLVQEIDIEINKNIARFVAQRYGKHSNIKQQGFEESQKRIDDLRTLLVEYSANTVYKGQISAKHHIDTFVLPTPGSFVGGADYQHLINVRALVGYAKCKDIDTEFEYYVEKPEDDCNCSVVVPGATQLIRYNNCIAGNHTWVCVYTHSTNRIIGTYVLDANGDPIYDWEGNFEFNSSGSTTSQGCKFIQHDDIYTLLEDPFNTTKYKKPLYTIFNNNLDMYTDNSFIVSAVKITYLRFPATVMFMGSVNCDLPEHTHQEIVDMTVNSLLEAISDPRYQTQSVEVLKSE